MYFHIISDFRVLNVFQNSHTTKPLLYKISGMWGNHEGSMLLWILVLTIFNYFIFKLYNKKNYNFISKVLEVQAFITLGFIVFTIFTSNPFEKIIPVPEDGLGFNPILQDPALAVHPPLLYIGYVGLSAAFSISVATLKLSTSNSIPWYTYMKPFVLTSWTFLSIGIALGSIWAYYELGWGGWWFWDPVENASFMPWLIAVALLHSAIVVEKRETLKSWTVLLAILGFSFSLIGTFIVRSGVITSVHAFANDPERGVFILLILIIAIGGALTLYAFRANSLRSSAVFSPISRESGLILNNLLLVVSTIVVFIGTIWPLVAELILGRKLSVGAPFFEIAFTPFMVVLAIFLPLGAILPWKRAQILRAGSPLIGALSLSLAIGLLIWSLQTGGRILAPIGLALSAWVILGALTDLLVRCRMIDIGFSAGLRRLINLTRADWGKTFAHIGLGLTIFGISAITAWETEDIRVAKIGEEFEVSGYTFIFEDVSKINGKNYTSDMGTISAFKNNKLVAILKPEKRFYPVQRMPTTEAGINSSLKRDLYIALGDFQDNGWTVRTYVKPYAVWIWIGCLIMAFGGLLSMTDRRLRFASTIRLKQK